MINDCAFVGETLLRNLPSEWEKRQIKRDRSLWGKTLGIASKIATSKADIYHVHYLLQDCYIASRLGKKPIIGHAHGSDLRTSLNHSLWGRLVRDNLKHCRKIIVSTPDILGIAQEYREDTEYLPNPVNGDLFYPKPPLPVKGKKKVLIASDSNWKVKGTDIAVRALAKIKDEVEVSIIQFGSDFEKTMSLATSLDLKLKVLSKAPHEKLNEYYWNADIVVDRFTLGSLGLISLEAIACGRPVLVYASSDYPENRDFPLEDLKTEEQIVEQICNLPIDLWEKEYSYLKKHHETKKIIAKLVKIYEESLKA